MTAEGLTSLFPMDDLTAMGINGVVAKLPTILRRLRETVNAIVAEPPDILILIDSPDFNLRVAKRVRRRLPELTIIDYVSPTVWVWRPGRARAMKPYIDHVLALLPFEPAVYTRLNGPPCSYVGHSLLQRLDDLRPSRRSRLRGIPACLWCSSCRAAGTRRSAVCCRSSATTIDRLAELRGRIDFVLPTLPRFAAEIAAITATWPVQPRIVVDEAEKYSAFRRARAALAASGTVTLELALSRIPTVAAYRVSAIEAPILRRVIRIPSTILPNLILEENIVPEFHQEKCTPDNLVNALEPLLAGGEARQRQLDGFARLDEAMAIGTEQPSERAARITRSRRPLIIVYSSFSCYNFGHVVFNRRINFCARATGQTCADWVGARTDGGGGSEQEWKRLNSNARFESKTISTFWSPAAAPPARQRQSVLPVLEPRSCLRSRPAVLAEWVLPALFRRSGRWAMANERWLAALRLS
jgi:lipid-A-disaccharide synthase